MRIHLSLRCGAGLRSPAVSSLGARGSIASAIPTMGS